MIEEPRPSLVSHTGGGSCLGFQVVLECHACLVLAPCASAFHLYHTFRSLSPKHLLRLRLPGKLLGLNVYNYSKYGTKCTKKDKEFPT